MCHFLYGCRVGEDARYLRVEQTGHAAKHNQACERRHTQQSKFVAGCEHFLVKACQWLEVVVLTEVQHQREQAEDLSVEAKLQEKPVVVLSHAVIDPGTVVVHLAYAVTASAAVVGAFGAHEIALVAQLPVLPL